MRRRDSGRYSAAFASAALHLGLLAAVLIVLPHAIKPLQVSDVVPVTLMTSAEVSNARAAEAAPQPAPAQTETPAPEAPPVQPAAQDNPEPAPQQPAPKPTPKPQPPKPQPKPIPTPKAAPAPAKPVAKAAPSEDEDFAALSNSIAHLSKNAGARKTAAARGPTHAETAVIARTTTGAGTAVSANALSSMAAELQRLWNPNCDVEGGADVNIKVTFRLGAGGRVLGQPQSSAGAVTDPVVRAASERAVRAVNQGQPFNDLPADVYQVNFNARQACAQR